MRKIEKNGLTRQKVSQRCVAKLDLGSLKMKTSVIKQDAQLSQRDRAAGCVTVFAKSRRLELGDNILRTL